MIHRSMPSRYDAVRAGSARSRVRCESLAEIAGSQRNSLCIFPHAGGTVADFLDWPSLVPGLDIDVLDLPGRSSRLHEEPLLDMESLATSAARARKFDSNTVLFGHSFGASLAVATCHEARRLGLPLPSTVAVSAAHPPPMHRDLQTLLEASNVELLRTLNEQFNTVPMDILDDADVADVLVRAVRADLTALAEYAPVDEDPLDSRLIILEPDHDTTTGAMEGWARYAKNVEHHIVPGGHFYIRDRSAMEFVSALLSARID